jgi:hypothetical protein
MVPFFSPHSQPTEPLLSRHTGVGALDLVTVLPTAVWLFLDGTPQAPGGPGALPFLTVQDILRTLHILRC